MTSREFTDVPGIPQPLRGFPQACLTIYDDGRRVLRTSMQYPPPELGGDPKAAVRAVMGNLVALLTAAEMTTGDVVRLTVAYRGSGDREMLQADLGDSLHAFFPVFGRRYWPVIELVGAPFGYLLGIALEAERDERAALSRRGSIPGAAR